MVSSVSYTPTSSPAHSDSENESHLSAASAASVGSAYKGGGGLRPTAVINLGGRYTYRTLDVLSDNSCVAFRIFTVSEATLTDLANGGTTLILQPIWEGNPDVATPETIDVMINTKRSVLRAYNSRDITKLEIFHNNNSAIKKAFITRVVIADLDTEAQVRAYPDRIGEIVPVKKTLTRKPRSVNCIVTELSKTFDHINRSKYTSSTISGIIEEQIRIGSQDFQQNLSSQLIHQMAKKTLQIAADDQAERQKQAEETRKQEAEEARIRERNKLADSLYWNAQKNAYYASQQASRQNGYYTPIPSNLSYATAKSVANDIAGMK